jgi:hypothetical protein
MSGHIFKIGFASQAKLKKQKNGGPKNSDQPAAGLHFSARHFSAASVRVPCFYKCVLTSGSRPMKAQEVMTGNVRNCAPEATLAEVAAIMWEADVARCPLCMTGTWKVNALFR